MDLVETDTVDGANGDKIFIRGLVIPAEWDETGKVMAVSIAAFNEEKYMVSDNPAGRELLHFIQHEVAVVGTLSFAGSKRFLAISDFFSFGDRSGY